MRDWLDWPWWISGPAIGIFAVAFSWATGKSMAVSSGFGAACARLMPDLSFFRKASFGERWRLLFVLGIPIGGFAGALLSGAGTPPSGLFESVFGSRLGVKLAVMFAGGLLVGFGARWAGGCTSGHSIMGIAQGEKASIVATLGFMAAGMLAANALFRLWGGR